MAGKSVKERLARLESLLERMAPALDVEDDPVNDRVILYDGNGDELVYPNRRDAPGVPQVVIKQPENKGPDMGSMLQGLAAMMAATRPQQTDWTPLLTAILPIVLKPLTDRPDPVAQMGAMMELGKGIADMATGGAAGQAAQIANAFGPYAMMMMGKDPAAAMQAIQAMQQGGGAPQANPTAVDEDARAKQAAEAYLKLVGQVQAAHAASQEG